jgi:subtilisin family serine protease
MLTDRDPGIPPGSLTRLIVEPATRVTTSVLPEEDPERAEAVCLACGVPERILRRHAARVRQTHRRANVVVLEVAADRRDALASDLRAAGFTSRPPRRVYPLLNESVPALRIPDVWKAGFEGAGVRVAIVDTGAYRHPDFADRIAVARDFTGHRGDDDVGHGTHVAGIVAGAGAVYRGVAPKATLVIAKALSTSGGTEDTVLAALSWASRQRIDVVNLSLGGAGDPTDPLSREVDALAGEGIIVCVAAGNSGPASGTIGSPGCAAGALTVGATDKERRLAEYSSRGPVPGLRAHKPEVVAIGGGVTPQATCHYGIGVASARAKALDRDRCVVAPRYVRMSGTSMATPHVAGLCAVLLEAARARSPKTSRIARGASVRRAVIQGAVDVGAGVDAAGAGIVDGARALAALVAAAAVREPMSSSSSPAMASSGIDPK